MFCALGRMRERSFTEMQTEKATPKGAWSKGRLFQSGMFTWPTPPTRLQGLWLERDPMDRETEERGDLGCSSCLSSKRKLLETPLELRGPTEPFLLMADSALTRSRPIPLFQETPGYLPREGLAQPTSKAGRHLSELLPDPLVQG